MVVQRAQDGMGPGKKVAIAPPKKVLPILPQKPAPTITKNGKNALPVTKNGVVSMPGKTTISTNKATAPKGSPIKGPVVPVNNNGIITLPKTSANNVPVKATTTTTKAATTTAPKTTAAPKTTTTTSSSLTQAQKDEIKRKALSGIALVSATPEKQALYDSFKPKATTTPKVTAPTNATTTGGVGANPYLAGDSSLVQSLMGIWNLNNKRTDAMMQKGFSYNAETDPSYQALQTLATKNAQVASRGAMEDMNDRGILNSTITSDRLGQIQQGAQDAVTAQIPALQQAAYGQWSDKLNFYNGNSMNAFNQANQLRMFEYGKGQDTIHNGFQQQQIDISRDNSDTSALSALWNMNQSTMPQIDTKAATNGAIAQLSQFKTQEDAMNFFKQNIGTFQNGGVDFNSLLTAMNKLWPDFSKKTGGLTFNAGN